MERKARKHKFSKAVALLSAVSMTVAGVLPAMGAPEEGNSEAEPLENQVLDLEFEGDLQDSSPAAHNVTASGSGYEYVDGVGGGQAVRLQGDTYINLGKEEDLQPENLTLSFWINPSETMTGEQVISWNKNEFSSDGWYLTSENDNAPLAISIGDNANGGQPYKVSVRADRAAFFPAGEWTHVAVTYDSATKEVCFYRNGVKREETAC